MHRITSSAQTSHRYPSTGNCWTERVAPCHGLVEGFALVLWCSFCVCFLSPACNNALLFSSYICHMLLCVTSHILHPLYICSSVCLVSQRLIFTACWLSQIIRISFCALLSISFTASFCNYCSSQSFLLISSISSTLACTLSFSFSFHAYCSNALQMFSSWLLSLRFASRSIRDGWQQI